MNAPTFLKKPATPPCAAHCPHTASDMSIIKYRFIVALLYKVVRGETVWGERSDIPPLLLLLVKELLHVGWMIGYAFLANEAASVGCYQHIVLYSYAAKVLIGL